MKKIYFVLLVVAIMIGLMVDAFFTYEDRFRLFDDYGVVDDYKLIDQSRANDWYCYYVQDDGDCKVITIKDDIVISECQVN